MYAGQAGLHDTILTAGWEGGGGQAGLHDTILTAGWEGGGGGGGGSTGFHHRPS